MGGGKEKQSTGNRTMVQSPILKRMERVGLIEHMKLEGERGEAKELSGRTLQAETARVRTPM